MREKYDANERTGSRNYSGRTEQSDQVAPLLAAHQQQRPVPVRGALGGTRPAPPQRLTSTSSTGTTTVGDRVHLVRLLCSNKPYL